MDHPSNPLASRPLLGVACEPLNSSLCLRQLEMSSDLNDYQTNWKELEDRNGNNKDLHHFFSILLFVHFVPFLLSNKSTALLNVQAKSLKASLRSSVEQPKTQILQILSSLPSAVVTPWVTNRPS